MAARYTRLLALLTGPLLAACTGARSPYDLQRDSPLGPSFWLIAVPSEDAGLLGRSFRKPPEASFTLEEQSEPNPCGAALSPAVAAPMANHYENAIRVSASAEGQGFLSAFGFSGQAASASHLLYEVATSQKLTKLDTTEYAQCCRAHDCGWGYVSALIYGEGEYVSARAGEASGSARYQLITARGKSSYEALDKKRIHGWVAAVLTAHDRSTAVHPCSLDSRWAGYECVALNQISFQRSACASNDADSSFWADSPNMQDMLRKQRAEACRWLDEHGLDRPAAAPR